MLIMLNLNPAIYATKFGGINQDSSDCAAVLQLSIIKSGVPVWIIDKVSCS